MNISLISTNTFPSDQGLRTISGCLKREGYNVKIIFLTYSETYSELYTKEILNQIKKEVKDSALIGISSMGSTANRGIQLIETLQETTPVIWGGPHPTFFPDECFKKCNIICLGEGEEAFVELAEKIQKEQNITKIRNLWVRTDKEYKNEVRPLLHDLDKLAHPDYDLKDHKILEKNKLIPFEEKHLAGMIFFQTERGCSQSCTYCTNHIFKELYKNKGSILRTHSVDYVIDELVRLKNKFKSIGVFDLRDETFLIRDINWIREFSEKYKKRVNIRFKCLADPASMSNEQITEEKLQLLVDAGLTDIIVGIQSGSDRLNFNVYKRYISAEQVFKASQSINKFSDKLAVMYDVITTNPYETKEDILATISLLLKIPTPYYLSVNNLVFFEGTKLYEQAIKDGFVKENEKTSDINYWDRWNHIKSKKQNAYLNLLLNLMRGHVTQHRFGIMPRNLIKKLLKEKIVNYNLKHFTPTFLAGQFVSLADFSRENIIKPLYRTMPVNFKLWYDKVRYKA